jgi:serine/threonine protein kinase
MAGRAKGQVGGMGEQLLGGRYQLEELIGTGGMSVVWRARDEVLGRLVAVKVLAGPDAAGARRIYDEARSAAAVSHPNLAQVFDFGESGGTPYVVMELIDGEALDRRIAEDPLPPDAALRVCSEVAAGLAAAHAAGLVHRDVKPGNIMLTPAGAKLVDFGIAASVDGTDPVTGEEVLGTPAYVAPERITGGAVTPASDVYALGVLLYRLLTGVLPWSAATTTQLIRDHVYTAPDPLPEVPGLPEAVARLCMSCLAKDPAARPTAEFVATALARAAAEPAEELRQRHRSRLVVAAVAVVGLAAAWLLSGATPLSGPAPWAGAGTDPPASASSAGASPAPGASAAPIAGTAGASSSAASPTPFDAGPPLPPASARPGSPTPAPTPALTTTGPAPGATRLTSQGGSVDATCTASGQVELSSLEPARSYKVEAAQQGPADVTGVTFRHGNTLVEMSVTCAGGTPSATTTTRQR